MVVSHAVLSLDRFGLDRHLLGTFRDGTARGSDLATFGVTIFFTLSGFLITVLLLQERDRTGTVAVGRFYVRRVLRIWPLYYAYIGIALLSLGPLSIAWSSDALAYYVLLLANVPRMFGGEIPLIDHLWSIGVEEQFYLFWPVMVMCTNDRRRLLWGTTVLCLLLVAGLIWSHFLLRPTGVRAPSILLGTTRFQCMLVGCIAAILFTDGRAWFMRLTGRRWVRLLAWTALVSIAFNRFPVPSFIANEAVSVMTVLLIMDQVSTARPLLSLERPLLDLLGRMSYSTYILHPLVIAVLAGVFPWSSLSVPWRYAAVLALCTGCSLGAAWLSYRFLESPILRLKDRFAVVHGRSGMRTEG